MSSSVSRLSRNGKPEKGINGHPSRKSPRKTKPAAPAFMEQIEDRCFLNRYIGLGARYTFVDHPLHPLIIPSGWARRIEGDFDCAECDFTKRLGALAWARAENQMALAEHGDAIQNGPTEFCWSI